MLLIKAIQFTTCMVVSGYHIAAAAIFWKYQRQIQAMVTHCQTWLNHRINNVCRFGTSKTFSQSYARRDSKSICTWPKTSVFYANKIQLYLIISWKCAWVWVHLDAWSSLPSISAHLWHYYDTDWLVSHGSQGLQFRQLSMNYWDLRNVSLLILELVPDLKAEKLTFSLTSHNFISFLELGEINHDCVNSSYIWLCQ